MASEPEKIDVREVIKSAEHVGNVYSYGTYGIDRIRITLKEGMKIPTGDYVFVVDDEGLPVVYQVSYPHWYKPSFDFEESLIVAGGPEKDEHRKRYRCVGVLVGRLDENGDISLPRYPVPPLTDVYKCPPDLVMLVTEPLDDWRIKIGENPETGRPVYMAIEPLVRQSLLITGAQGTGKTTALLTIIARAVEVNPSLHFLILDWTGEFLSLTQLGNKKVFVCTWEDFVGKYVAIKPDIVEGLLKTDPRMKGAVEDCILQALYECKGIPTIDSICEKIDKQEKRWASTREVAKAVVRDNMPKEYPGALEESIEKLVTLYNIVIVDFSLSKSLPDEFGFKRKVSACIAETIWKKATTDKNFGCIIVSDEAHRICPQFDSMEGIWLRLATEGGRNCCPFWLVARRLSLVKKSVTVESQQNIICFNVEDIDRKRIEEDIGTTFAGMLGALPQGEAMVKSAMAFRVSGQTIHVKFDQVIKPASAAYRAKERFQSMASSSKAQ